MLANVRNGWKADVRSPSVANITPSPEIEHGPKSYHNESGGGRIAGAFGSFDLRCTGPAITLERHNQTGQKEDRRPIDDSHEYDAPFHSGRLSMTLMSAMGRKLTLQLIRPRRG